jgi:DNA replication protein DnaC
VILLPLVLATTTAVAPVISAERIREDVRVLASDEFEGRGPGEAGERKTVDYLSKAFAAAGLEPGGVDGLWTQPVPLVRLDRQPGAKLSLTIAGHPIALTAGGNAALTLRNNRRLQAAMRSSRLPAVKTLESFDFAFQPSIKREQIESVHELNFIERKENVVMLGPPGVGKSHLAISLAIAASTTAR